MTGTCVEAVCCARWTLFNRQNGSVSVGRRVLRQSRVLFLTRPTVDGTWPSGRPASVGRAANQVRNRIQDQRNTRRPLTRNYDDKMLWTGLGEQRRRMPRPTNVIAAVRLRVISNHSAAACEAFKYECGTQHFSVFRLNIIQRHATAVVARAK